MVAYGEADPHQPVTDEAELFVSLQPNCGILTELSCSLAILEFGTGTGSKTISPGEKCPVKRKSCSCHKLAGLWIFLSNLFVISRQMFVYIQTNTAILANLLASFSFLESPA
jgi:hypothetical protein